MNQPLPRSKSIYLLREREFIERRLRVYKIGRTGNHPNRRLGNYPKDSEIHLVISVRNEVAAETYLIGVFKDTFTHREDIGNEYFEGDVQRMKEIVANYGLNNFENTRPPSLFSSSKEIREIPLQNKPMEPPQKTLTELKLECQTLGLPVSGNREAICKRLDLYKSIEKVPEDTLRAMANSAGFSLAKTGTLARLEYVKKFSKLRRGSDAPKSNEVMEKPEGSNSLEKIEKLEDFIKKLELKIISQQFQINHLEKKLETLFSNPKFSGNPV